MNREILYKAKELKTGKWVEGFYCCKDETTYCVKEDYERHPVKTQHYIIQERMTDWGLPNEFRLYEIDPKTLCQFVKTDKVTVWENDIVRWEDDDEVISVIKYDVENARFILEDYGIKGCLMEYGYDENAGDFCKLDSNGFDAFYSFGFEVIGNIFDNPELLTDKLSKGE